MSETTPAESPAGRRGPGRIGGHLVAESLEALGADTAFGLPGQHALGLFDGLSRSGVRFIGSRTEVAASFAAHGYSVTAGRVAPLLVSTGPGALMSLAGLQEAEASGAPVLCISSQIPREGLGRNRGYVHELRNQIEHFRPLVKAAHTVLSVETIPDVLALAWREALSPPSGPVFVEIPVDVLGESTSAPIPRDLDGRPTPLPPRRDSVERVLRAIQAAESVTIVAGGGVLRAGAWTELRGLAERLGAPVVMTYGGKGAIPADHPLCAGSACERAEVMELIGDTDLAIVVGSSLSEETSNHRSLQFRGDLVQIDPDPKRLGTYHAAETMLADAKPTLQALLDGLGDRRPTTDGAQRAATVREAVTHAFRQEGRALESELLGRIDEALPGDAVSAWDMTIAAYWAAMAFPVASPRRYLFPQGSGSLGYGFPAGLGAKAALPEGQVLAICGDGGILYGLAEIATARQNGLDTKLLIIDDGGYGVLREFQRESFGRTFATDLTRPDFAAVCRAFGISARNVRVDDLADGVGWALAEDGPAAVVLDAEPVMYAPTHYRPGE